MNFIVNLSSDFRTLFEVLKPLGTLAGAVADLIKIFAPFKR